MPLQRLESGALVQHAAWIALHLAGYDNRARVLDTYRWPWPMKKPPSVRRAWDERRM